MKFILIQEILNNIIEEDNHKHFYIENEYGFKEFRILTKEEYCSNDPIVIMMM